MAVARTRSVALVGVAGRPVEVEADVGNGLACIHLIGLPDTALSEARERVRSAMVNSHYPSGMGKELDKCSFDHPSGRLWAVSREAILCGRPS
ncbi:magnesium chelatase domain-containing protein [Nonomuraea sp. LPB2021202275-12-8]|uniref:magnesium chelatase domain-containing protein n=1 Tax=Nonomuraea sp. LPB2021202275-12-8 TaxID=3120159 RepID=UPI00300C2230